MVDSPYNYAALSLSKSRRSSDLGDLLQLVHHCIGDHCSWKVIFGSKRPCDFAMAWQLWLLKKVLEEHQLYDVVPSGK